MLKKPRKQRGAYAAFLCGNKLPFSEAMFFRAMFTRMTVTIGV